MTDTRELKACPFCGATELERNDSKFWTGRENTTTRYRIQHHCKDVEGRVYRSIEVAGTTEAEMISAWQARSQDSRCGGGLLEAAKPFALGRHIFSRSDDDRDTCSICGKNFRNTEYHFTANEGTATDRQRLTKAIAAFESSHE